MKSVVLWVAATAAALVFGAAALAQQRAGQVPSLYSAGLVLGIGHAGAVYLDRRRRGEESGFWPLAAGLLGPVGTCAYLAVAYRERAVAWVSVYVGLLSLLAGAVVWTTAEFTRPRICVERPPVP